MIQLSNFETCDIRGAPAACSMAGTEHINVPNPGQFLLHTEEMNVLHHGVHLTLCMSLLFSLALLCHTAVLALQLMLLLVLQTCLAWLAALPSRATVQPKIWIVGNFQIRKDSIAI